MRKKAFLFILSLSTWTACPGHSGSVITPHSNSCLHHIRQAEQNHGIPRHLLLAIAKLESGRKNESGQINPWPWTINVEGKGYHYDTKAQAIAAVTKFKGQGKRSIDVGCMQVNLLHHPDAFDSLNSAFNPSDNVAYAAQFLKDLFTAHGSWEKAVAHYHSATPKYHIPYKQKVLALWKNQKSLPSASPLLSFRDQPKDPKIEGRLQRLKAMASNRASLYKNSDRSQKRVAKRRRERPREASVESTEPHLIPAAADLPPEVTPQPSHRVVRGKVIKRKRMAAPTHPRPGQIKSRKVRKGTGAKK